MCNVIHCVQTEKLRVIQHFSNVENFKIFQFNWFYLRKLEFCSFTVIYLLKYKWDKMKERLITKYSEAFIQLSPKIYGYENWVC